MARPRNDGTASRQPNKRNLTELFVRKVTTDTTPINVWDEKERGLVLRVHPTGRRAFKVVYSRRGRPRWFHVGDVGLAEARLRAREIKASLDPQCLSGFRKNEKFEIEHSDVILTVDNGDFVFLDCAYEELLQSLGPINDTATVPWTMFNDNISMGYFDVYDQYILNLLYDPRIRPGMTVEEVKAVLPAALADVRAWVRKVNNLPE